MKTEEDASAFEVVLPRKMALAEIQELDRLVREAIKTGKPEIRLDAREVEEIGSWLVGVFVSLGREAKEYGARFLISNLTRENVEFFKSMGLSQLFSIPQGDDKLPENEELFLGRVHFEETDGIALIGLVGSIDHPALSRELRAAGEMAMPKAKALLIDFSETAFLDSEAVGQIIHLHQKLTAAGKELCVCGMNDIITDIFNSLGLSYLIREFPNAEQAKKILRGQ